MNECFEVGDLVVDVGRRTVSRGSQELVLPKLSFDLLAELIRAAPNTLSVDDLIDRVWGGRVVNPATVSKRVELLRQALDDDSHDSRYVALVRGHGYRLVAAVKISDSGRQSKRSLAIVTTLVLLALAIAATWVFDSPSRPPPARSVAVLPFVSMTEDVDDEHLADGLTEELSHALAGVHGLKVAGRTSSFFYKGKNEDMREIGRSLGVAHLLEGSVRRSDDRLRITAQLISVDDGFHLWSNTYDRTMMDVLEIQEDIARHVVAKLRNTLFDDQEPVFVRETLDPRAYALYLRALNPPGFTGSDRLGEAQRLLEEAVELDPTFAAAWARLATVHGKRIMGMDESYPYSREEGWRRIVEANDNALALDPNNAQTHANLGGIAWLLEGNAAKAAPLIKRALELDPSDLEIVSFAADFAKLIDRVDHAIELEEYVLERDPLCNDCRFNLGKSYLFAGRLDEAEEIFRTLRIVWGGGLEWNLGVILLSKGDPQAALESFEELDHHEYIRIQGRAMALYDLGRHADFESAMQELQTGWGDDFPTVVAEAYAYVGQSDATFEWLEKAVATNLVDLQTDFLEPTFNKIRDDARWHSLMEKIGRSPEQLAEIDFQVDLGE
ncbi:MAG: tetratricopeptide repeat protein [Woeseiaceae bacterium]